ncbi:MAG TPA: cupredoxin domain-containing protein [Candidatus Limnocylindria bacterium]
MSGRRATGNPQHRPGSVELEPRPSAVRYVAAGLLVLGILGAGLVLGFGDFFGRPNASDATAATPVRLSMAGFTPGTITARPGQVLKLDLWTTDAAPHLQGGVHTLISDELGIREELPAESRRIVELQMPTTPGEYDIYCDTCCGGKASPTMHGTIRVEAA